jgi:hypothetical protein
MASHVSECRQRIAGTIGGVTFEVGERYAVETSFTDGLRSLDSDLPAHRSRALIDPPG